MTQTCLLTLVAAPVMEETLVDWLLQHERVIGFSSVAIDGHGARDTHYSLLEQVTGRQRRIQFMAHMPEETARALIAELQQKYAGTGLHYMMTPVLETGQI